jgi:hypothetical protein
MIPRFKKRTGGSAITEMGPALFILLIAIFFPLLDLALVGLAYFSCATLNDLQTNKAAMLPQSEAESEGGPVKKGVREAWQLSAIGTLARLAGEPSTDVSYTEFGADQCVVVSTSFSVKPFLPIPFIPGVPGISAPVGFTIQGKRLLEDPSNLGK